MTSPQNLHISVSELLVRFGPLSLNRWSVIIWHSVKQTNKYSCTAYADASLDTLNIEGLDCLPVSKPHYLGTHTPSPCCATLLSGLSAPLPSLPSSLSLQHTQTSTCTHAEAANRRAPVSPLLATQCLVARTTGRHETHFT